MFLHGSVAVMKCVGDHEVTAMKYIERPAGFTVMELGCSMNTSKGVLRTKN